MSGDVQKAIGHFSEHKNFYLEELKNLVRIPSVSFAGFPKAELDRSAQATLHHLETCGLENLQILTHPKAPPAVYGEKIVDKKLPTILLYAHHDVQPAGDLSLWKSDPFEPTERDGRLFGRGTADDKAGIAIHTAAIHSWLKTHQTCPVNIKMFVEGEEEVGSPHLGDFLTQYRELLKADVLILTDTSNFDVGIPALTVSLRGLVALSVEVRALDHALHSGFWGGILPDPAMALSKILASVVDEKGGICVPEILEQVKPVSDLVKKQLSAIPLNHQILKEQAGLLHGELLLDGKNPYQKLWYEPSFLINTFQASEKSNARNIICDSAWARIGLRLSAGMDPIKTRDALINHLKKECPWGLDIQFKVESCSPGWTTNTEHPAFKAAFAAMQSGFGKECLAIGCGASIPFVEIFEKAMPGVPALLMGVEDPQSNAHGENESLHLGDFEKAVKSAINLYRNLAL